MTISVGEPGPDFTLSDTARQQVTLSSFRGDKAVLLVFFPAAFTGICTGELCAVRDNLATFANDKVQVLGVSCDSAFALDAWRQQQGYTFPLLSDFWPHGQVARSYGTFLDEVGLSARGTFLIDIDGMVRFAEVNPPSAARDQQGWVEAIAAL